MTGTHYFVLLIITDGVITDMVQTKEAIVSVSHTNKKYISDYIMLKYYGSIYKCYYTVK